MKTTIQTKQGEPLAEERVFLGLNKNGWIVTLTSLFGWTLVNIDASLFSFVYPLIQQELGLPDSAVGMIVTATAIAGILGTLVIGPLMDYFGRKNIFQWTILASAVGSALSALSGGLWSLLFARSLTQIGHATELMVGQVMVTEGTPSRSRGWWTGIAQIGYPLGWFLTSLIAFTLVPIWGWRGIFWAGLLPLVLIIWARIFVKESDRFEDIRRLRKEAANKQEAAQTETQYRVKKEQAVRFTFSQLFAKDLRRKTILFWLWQFLYNYGTFCVMMFLPSVAAARGFTLTDSWTITAWGTGVGAIGYIVSSFLGNRFGRRGICIIWLLIGGVAGTFFAFSVNTPGQMALWWALYYFFTVGHFASFISYMLESFPTRVRGTGASFINFSVLFGLLLAGATSQVLMSVMGVSLATFLFLGVFPWIAMLCALASPKIKPGQELEDIAV